MPSAPATALTELWWLQAAGNHASTGVTGTEVSAVAVNYNSGEVGELCCRGPYTLWGYFGAPEHNARAFTADGFYRSGDLMRRHESGSRVVEGRKKDLNNRGGENISAEEIENLILAHPAVLNVASVPVADEVLGERMCAGVVLRTGADLTLDELTEFLLNFEIAKHKLPERLEIYATLPLSPVGKVSTKDLVARLAGPPPLRSTFKR